MSNYWSMRMRDAEAKERWSTNQELRDVYHQLAAHYRAMGNLWPILDESIDPKI